MTEAVLGLGANLGSPREAMALAVGALEQTPGIEVVAVAGLWRSAAVGGPAQPDFLNTTVVVSVLVDPQGLLHVAHELEDDAGRVRSVRWGPRTLDVDILAFGDLRSDDPELTLPHPRAHERAFVLLPWAQVQPDRILVAVGQQRSVAAWAAAVDDQRVEQVAEGTWWA